MYHSTLGLRVTKKEKRKKAGIQTLPSLAQSFVEGCSALLPRSTHLFSFDTWFRGGLVVKAHRLLYHSPLGWRVIKKKRSWTPGHSGGIRMSAREPASRRGRTGRKLITFQEATWRSSKVSPPLNSRVVRDQICTT